MSANDKPLLVQPPFQVASRQPTAPVQPDQFEQSIQENGTTVWYEKAHRCPCYTKQVGGHLKTCKNCGGSGFFFVNKKETRMLVSSVGYRKDFPGWTDATIGTVNLTPSRRDQLAYMDRITIAGQLATFTQLLTLNRRDANRWFAFLTYSPIEILDAWLFVSPGEKLTRLADVVQVVDNVLFVQQSHLQAALDADPDVNPTLSVRYQHHPSFNVIEVMRDTSVFPLKGLPGDRKTQNMPQNAIARRTHFVPDAPNVNGEGLLDNSYETPTRC